MAFAASGKCGGMDQKGRLQYSTDAAEIPPRDNLHALFHRHQLGVEQQVRLVHFLSGASMHDTRGLQHTRTISFIVRHRDKTQTEKAPLTADIMTL